MANLTTNFIVYHGGFRHKRAKQITKLKDQKIGTATAGNLFPITIFDTIEKNGDLYQFAFVSVTGAQDGNHVYFTANAPNIPVGYNDINILIVYVPKGGSGESHGAYVDAFNVDIGDVSGSNFVRVYTNNALDTVETHNANCEGEISTGNAAEDARAYSAVDSVPFLEWKKIISDDTGTEPDADTNEDYTFPKDAGGIAFAFYQTPQTPSRPPIFVHPIYRGKPIGEVTVDGPGGFILSNGTIISVHPYSPLGPVMEKLMNTAAIISLSSDMGDSVKEDAGNLAIECLHAVEESIKTMGLSSKESVIKSKPGHTKQSRKLK